MSYSTLVTNGSLTFDDEFSGTSLNTWNGTSGLWTTSFWGDNRNLYTNGEQELYVDPGFMGTGPQPLGLNPFTEQNGTLSITATPSTPAEQAVFGPYGYTSGLLTTRDSFAQEYGTFDIRAELPQGDGLWPAFWLLPADGSGPAEIDIFEAFGGANPGGYGGANQIHVGTVSTANTAAPEWVTVNADIYTSYNDYSVDWEPNTITWYFNGQEIFQEATPADMHQPMYILANLAVGGYFPGDPDSTTPFPASESIDYVHVYSSPDSITLTNPGPGPQSGAPNSWVSEISGTWNDPSNWSGGVIPNGRTVDATIDADPKTLVGTDRIYTVTLPPGPAITLHDLTLNGGTVIAEGTLDLTGTLTAGKGNVLIAGGTISGGTVDQAGGNLTFLYETANLLKGVHVLGELTLNNGFVALTGGARVLAADGVTPGTVAVDYYGALDLAGSQTLHGTVLLNDPTAVLAAGASDGVSADKLTIGSDGTVVGTGSIQISTFGTIGPATLVNNGTIEATGGLLTVTGPFTGGAAGKLLIDTTGTLELGASFSQTVTYSGQGGVLQLDAQQAAARTLSGFGAGDSIDLRYLAYGGSVTDTLVKGRAPTLTIRESGQAVGTFKLAALGSLTGVTLSDDGSGGTLIKAF